MRFKVWDVQENKWFEEINDAQNGNIKQMVLFQKGFLVMRANEKMILCEKTWPGRFHKVTGSMIMDRTKVEIYLGDILRIKGQKSFFRVIFLKGMFAISEIGTDDCYPLADYAIVSKIVGNQYEQPYYLKTKANAELN